MNTLTTARAAAATLTDPRAAAVLAAFTGGGHYVAVEWDRSVTLAAASRKAGHAARKASVATVQAGMDYANLAHNRERETGSLPEGQEWIAFPWLIATKNGILVRLYILEDTRVSTTWTLDGVAVDKAAVVAHMTAGDAAKATGKPYSVTFPDGATATVYAPDMMAAGGKARRDGAYPVAVKPAPAMRTFTVKLDDVRKINGHVI